MTEIRARYHRIAQLEAYRNALEALVASLRRHPPYLVDPDLLEVQLAACRRLLAAGFTSPMLAELSLAFPPFVDTYREWLPPRVDLPDGARDVPPWFPDLKILHHRARDAAFALRVLGEY